jgi:hypothetical protein
MTQDINLDGFAGAAPTTTRGARFKEGRYFVRVTSFTAKKSQQDETKTLYIVDGTVIHRLSEKGNDPGQHVAYVMQKGTFANAQKALMGQVKAAMIGIVGLQKELNDEKTAASTALRVLGQNLASGRIVEVVAEMNDKGNYVQPSFLRQVPAAEWSGVVKPEILAEVFGAGNADVARQKIGAIIDAESTTKA